MFTGAGNAIPLPPRDRSRPVPASKPRHQRKHPLIIPGNATRTLAKLSHNQSGSYTIALCIVQYKIKQETNIEYIVSRTYIFGIGR